MSADLNGAVYRIPDSWLKSIDRDVLVARYLISRMGVLAGH